MDRDNLKVSDLVMHVNDLRLRIGVGIVLNPKEVDWVTEFGWWEVYWFVPKRTQLHLTHHLFKIDLEKIK